MKSDALEQVDHVEAILKACEQLDGDPTRDRAPLHVVFYGKPDSRLPKMIADFETYRAKPEKARTDEDRERAGKLLERIVCAAFRSLRGYDSVESYRSPAFQVDLLVNGSTAYWRLLCSTLRIDSDKRGILVEAKARTGLSREAGTGEKGKARAGPLRGEDASSALSLAVTDSGRRVRLGGHPRPCRAGLIAAPARDEDPRGGSACGAEP